MAEYIECTNLLDGISSPEFGLDEIIDELIYKHNLDFLHDNDEDVVREFAKDLICSIKNYIKTEPTANVEEVIHAKWEINCDGYYPYCSHCKTEPKNGVMSKRCPECGARMDGGKTE